MRTICWLEKVSSFFGTAEIHLWSTFGLILVNCMLFIVCRRMDVLDLCLKCLQLVLSMYTHTHTVTASWVLEKCMNLDFWFVLSSSRVNKKDVLWIHRRIHPSFFCSLSGFGSWGQPSEQRSPDFPQPNHLFQLIRGHWSVPKPVERCNLCSESCEFIFSLSCLHRTVGAAMHLCRI